MPRCWVTNKELFARAGEGSTQGGLGRSPGGYPRPGHALPERVAGPHNASHVVEGGGRGGMGGAAGNAVTLSGASTECIAAAPFLSKGN